MHREIEFDEHNRDLIFRELEERFGFPARKWKAKFQYDLQFIPRNRLESHFFKAWAARHIAPILNAILLRHDDLLDTWSRFANYVLLEKHDVLKQKRRSQLDFGFKTPDDPGHTITLKRGKIHSKAS